jgi:hypothetical protein
VQKITTKRCQITIAQQLRWHGLIESVWQDQARLNLPSEDFDTKKAYFMLNLDETCVMANDGAVHIIGDAKKKRHDKIMDDNRGSITIVRIGSAAGCEGPQIFLAAGKTMEVKALNNLELLGAPKYSKIIMTPTAYMTDEAWAEAAPLLAKGIRSMKVIILY